jgi:hypothetical protein
MFIPFKEMKTAPFASYEEIPPLTKEYILYVSAEKEVTDIPLEDINGFLLDLYAYEKAIHEEWSDGWVM